jgi:predicted nucleotide-binding protein
MDERQQALFNRPQTLLSLSRDHAIEIVGLQIESGQLFLKLISHDLTETQIDEIRFEYERWDEHNILILNDLFVEKDFLGEYVGMSTLKRVGTDYNDKLAVYKKLFTENLDVLNMVARRLKLIIPSIDRIRIGLGEKKMSNNSASRKVFIVHGHDEAAKESLARVLEKLDLKAIILHEQADGGKTLIEKFEEHSSDVVFAVILLTPDDDGKSKSEIDLKGRARQNVIFELGYFIGKLGRGKVVLLYKGGEIPSDLQGVIYKSMLDGAWRLELAKEIKNAGIEVDLNKL